jgi:hypothetical protein
VYLECLLYMRVGSEFRIFENGLQNLPKLSEKFKSCYQPQGEACREQT